MPRVVLCNGVFDPLHVGHIYHLQAAKRLGDVLIVSLTCDESATKEKGPGRPVFNQVHREAMLRALRCVDGVVVCTDALDALQKVRPSIFAKGSDYRGRISDSNHEYCERHGIQIIFTDELTFSSTKLLKHYAGARRG